MNFDEFKEYISRKFKWSSIARSAAIFGYEKGKEFTENEFTEKELEDPGKISDYTGQDFDI